MCTRILMYALVLLLVDHHIKLSEDMLLLCIGMGGLAVLLDILFGGK